jgi:hypothetical protein
VLEDRAITFLVAGDRRYRVPENLNGLEDLWKRQHIHAVLEAMQVPAGVL